MLRALVETVIIAVANLEIRDRRFNYQRWRLLRLAGMRIEKCEIASPFTLTQYGQLERISIGGGTFINTGLRIGVGDQATVRIGHNCAIGPNVALETMTHELQWTRERGWGGEARDITIEDRCWIAANVTIVGGVTVGHDSVVAAGAVVTRDIPPHSLAAGVPARVIRQLA